MVIIFILEGEGKTESFRDLGSQLPRTTEHYVNQCFLDYKNDTTKQYANIKISVYNISSTYLKACPCNPALLFPRLKRLGESFF